MNRHYYLLNITWTGNTGSGTASDQSYERSYNINGEAKQVIEGSSDPAFIGDPTKYNPEEMLLAAISSCHMLWYLHFCSSEGIVVESYTDNAEGKNGDYRE